MKHIHGVLVGFALVSLSATVQAHSRYHDTVALFHESGQRDSFFPKSYAYAVFPTVGEGALGVGAAHCAGHVYVHGKWVAMSR